MAEEEMAGEEITDAEIESLLVLCENASCPPWQALVEGRDHWSGDSFIMIGPPDRRQVDMYVYRETSAVAAADLDFIAQARNYMPRLLREVQRLRASRDAERDGER